MLTIIKNIIVRLLYAIIPSIIYTIISLIITLVLYNLKNKDIPNDFYDIFQYLWLSNYIIIFLCLCFFLRENIQLF